MKIKILLLTKLLMKRRVDSSCYPKKKHLSRYVPGTSHPSVLQASSNIQAAAKSLPKIQSTLDKSARLF